MSDLVNKAIEDLGRNATEVQAVFGRFSAAELNWKPGEKSWSIAQCLDHLIVTHSMYFPIFEKLAGGQVKPSLWERISPFSGMFGRMLIKSIDPANLKPSKTSRKAYPSSSDIDGAIVARYVEHQEQVIKAIRKLPREIDPATIITSPLMGLVTYSLGDTLTLLPMHCTRHTNQAKRVMETAGFPTG